MGISSFFELVDIKVLIQCIYRAYEMSSKFVTIPSNIKVVVGITLQSSFGSKCFPFLV